MSLPKARVKKKASRWWIIAIIFAVILAAGAVALVQLRTRPPKPFAAVVTLALARTSDEQVKNYHEPFGIAVNQTGDIYFSESNSGRVYRIPASGYSKQSLSQETIVAAEGFETPSAIAFERDGKMIVANTGAHTIARIDFKTYKWRTIAGKDGVSGFTDGSGKEARFNGPVGLAVDGDGTIFVADTYNDRIRAISPEGLVRTLAGGGEPGFKDGAGEEARFDTPCGIAIARDGSLLIADTGNHRIRRVEKDGRVSTLAGTGEAGIGDGVPGDAEFYEPLAIAVLDADRFYVADAETIRLCILKEHGGEKESVKTIAGGYSYGMLDGELAKARINSPTGLALLPGGELVFADGGNGLMRAFVPADSKIGLRAEAESVITRPEKLRELLEPRWPYDPPEALRDIAGTFGEIRGERLPDQEAHFHNGVDIPGAYGETVRAIFSERVTRPLAAEGAGDIRERLRLPFFQYIHLRIGRDQNDQLLGNFAPGAITFQRAADNRIVSVRVRRGTRINAGEPIGTLNQFNHVHLVAGPPAYEINALLLLRLPGLADTVPPAIEDVTILNGRNEPLNERGKAAGVSGKLRIAARVYDRIDGNPRYRRLGIYRLGYQVLEADGSPTPEFKEPRYNIVFDRLPEDPGAVFLAFADGSQSGYSGQTVFNYFVTNVVRGGEAHEDFWDTSKLAAGNYTLRVIAEDHFGNQSRRDVPVRVEK
jgi:sugar lactone lactonase YvrE